MMFKEWGFLMIRGWWLIWAIVFFDWVRVFLFWIIWVGVMFRDSKVVVVWEIWVDLIIMIKDRLV